MQDSLTLYECGKLMAEIDERSEQNGGDISDADLQALVVAHTTSIACLKKLCGLIAYVRGWNEQAKAEEQRIAAKRKRNEKRLESIEKYLVPFIAEYKAKHGHPLDVGTFSLSTRRSESVEIDELAFFTDANRKKWCTEKVTYQPDKKRIKAELDNPLADIPGAKIVAHESLQVR